MSRLRRRRPDDGFTLVELLVAMALMSMLGILVMTTVASGLRTSARGEKRTLDATATQRAVLEVVADLRAAAKVVTATPTRVVLFTRSDLLPGESPTDGPVERVTYDVAGGVLTQTRETGTGPLDNSWVSATTRTSDLVKGVLAPAQAGRPVFTYLSVDDSQRQCGTGPTVGTLGASVTTNADLDRIYTVEVWLSVNSAPALGARPLVVPGSAVLVNRGQLTLGAAYLTQLGIGQGCS